MPQEGTINKCKRTVVTWAFFDCFCTEWFSKHEPQLESNRGRVHNASPSFLSVMPYYKSTDFVVGSIKDQQNSSNIFVRKCRWYSYIFSHYIANWLTGSWNHVYLYDLIFTFLKNMSSSRLKWYMNLGTTRKENMGRIILPASFIPLEYSNPEYLACFS